MSVNSALCDRWITWVLQAKNMLSMIWVMIKELHKTVSVVMMSYSEEIHNVG